MANIEKETTMTTIENLQSDLLNLMAKTYRTTKSLSFPQLRTRVRGQIYSEGTKEQLDHLDSLDAMQFNRLASQAYDLQAGGFEL
jgi:hypothetical protein